MITRMKSIFFLTFFALSLCHAAENKPNQSLVSEDLAHVLWNIMETYEGEYSFEELLVNLWKLSSGKLQHKPLGDCYASLMESMTNKATERGMNNLQIANSYLQKIKTAEGVNELVEDKLYYKVEHYGEGEKIKDSNSAPLISFKEKTLSEKILTEHSGIRLPLSEVISGLRQGIEGIRVGEKRKIFIHPDYAYGEFPKPEPHSVIVIEVTLLSL